MFCMKKIITIVCLLLLLTACNSDEISKNSIFDTTSPERNEFDEWIYQNFTVPYNLEFNYLYSDKLSDNLYNVVPATVTNSKAIAILLKHVWTDVYTKVGGVDFLKYNSFRQIQLIGSAEYDGNSIVLGTAEAGLKVLLFRVNELDLDNIYINQDNPYRDHQATPMDLNYWFFHTMHHEYCHILNQRKNFSTDFKTLMNKDVYKSDKLGEYRSSDWVNLENDEAGPYGFVTNYASLDYNEDFAEVYSNYVCSSEKGWNVILENAIRYQDEDGNKLATPDTRGRDLILEKLAIVREYFRESWNINIDTLRQEVTDRSAEAQTLDLRHLKF